MATNLIKKLKSEGWQERFTASGTHLQEAIDNYQALGFEVKLIPAKELVSDGCNVCFDDEGDEAMMIFTKKSSATKNIDLRDDKDV